jgi:preprotein translocase SecE subunit
MADDDNKKPDDKNKKHDDKKSSKKESLGKRIATWFHDKKVEFSTEFKRIVWPGRVQLVKETVIVRAVSLLFGAYIMALDFGFGYLLSEFSHRIASRFM